MNSDTKRLYKLKFYSIEKELRKQDYFMETSAIGNKYSQLRLKACVYTNKHKDFYLGSFDELNKQIDNHKDSKYTEILNKINRDYS